MQLTIDIQNKSIAEKILSMLEHFKNDGVEVLQLNSKNEKEILDDTRLL